ncbi:MAG: hypothetical protein F6K24_13240 [Okeania sp. SIO2D1]|nr:hypothetical protein [Okeania sp. SIO2D1]
MITALAVEKLSIITKVEPNTITILVIDFLIAFSVDSEARARELVNLLYDAIRKTPVPPEEFFQAFEMSRRILLQKKVSPEVFLNRLGQCLESGVPPSDVYEELESMTSDNNK